MLQFGAVAFASPWLLLALAGLPVLWWLLRITPPSPRTLTFPAIRLLFGLRPPEETPARTPLWLLILRFLIIALIIFGLAQPLLNPAAKLYGSGPVILAIDDGWAAARNWSARESVLDGLLSQAEREKRPVILVTTAPAASGEPATVSDLLTPSDARRQVQGLKPKPWASDRRTVLDALDALDVAGTAHAVWLSDGLHDDGVTEFARRLQSLGRLDVLRDDDGSLSRLLLPPESDGLALLLRLRRAAALGPDTVQVLARGGDGRLVAQSDVAFEAGASEAEALLQLPVELRNRIARLSIKGEAQAGAVQLLDERWRRRPVGLVSTGPGEIAQPLLSELYYMERALAPFTELRDGGIGELLNQSLAVIALADIGSLPEPEHGLLADWVAAGGLLLRFAGPRLADGGGDDLMPVNLRGGGRTLGGVLTWDSPSRLATFDGESPFAGLAVPDDVLINRQVLAEPSLDLGDRTWARLTDGTPLVTAERRGEGWVVLVHTTANTDWSNLVLSGLFPDMLRRIVAVSQGVVGEQMAHEDLPPIETLNGFGQLTAPAPTVLAIKHDTLSSGAIGPEHPPGYYGNEGFRRAHNLAGPESRLEVIRDLPPGVSAESYAESSEVQLKPWLLAAALILGLVDLIASLILRGLMRRPASQSTAALLLLLLPLLSAGLWAGAPTAKAQTRIGSDRAGSASDLFALEATLETRLAFVRTGVPAVDNVSRAGLFGLTRLLQRRTSVEPGVPMEVDLGRDEIAFFPLLYWPMAPEQRSLDDTAQRKINEYLANGGTIIFDTREPSAGIQILGRTSPNGEALRRITEGLDIPRLIPVPPDHVLTKSFYLMQDFPGRYGGGTLWISDSEGRVNDGVASVIIGANDWAAAWAIGDTGRPLFAVVPGGERQREMAYRVGVNVVMYALTGNYKADQVHVPFILERLGQ